MTLSPKYAATEDALHLLLHARVGIAGANSLAPEPVGRVFLGPFTSSGSYSAWLPEVALLRIISIVEAYVDVISMHRMNHAVDRSKDVLRLLLADFELSSSANWNERHSAFERYHGFSLRGESGWQQVAAGIEVRNCLAHGMGRLTAKQRTKAAIARQVEMIDVTISSNRMQLAGSTLTKLGEAATSLVRSIDEKIVLT